MGELKRLPFTFRCNLIILHLMKILCVSDETEPLVYSKHSKEHFRECDFVISSGDLPLNYYDYIMTIQSKILYYVYGNHNLEQFDLDMGHVMDRNGTRLERDGTLHMNRFGGDLIDGRCVVDQKSGLIIAGLGGSRLYNGGKSQYTEAQMKLRMAKLIPQLMYNKIRYGRYLDILVTHAAPYGIGDGPDPCHRGFECFLSFMERFRPQYLLHGHIHLYDENSNRITDYKGTKVVNVYKSFVLEVAEPKGKKI